MFLTTTLLRRLKKHPTRFVLSTLLLLFSIVLLWPLMVHTIQAGEAGVLYLRFFGGTVVDRVYGEGFKVIFPWDRLTIYNVRYQAIPRELTVLNVNGLETDVEVTIRFKPEYVTLGILHQRVGEDYADKIIVPEVEAVLRQSLGKYTADEVYKAEPGMIEKMVNESLEQMSQKFIVMDDVIIRKITLPQKIRDAIEEKVAEKQKLQAYEFKVEKEKREAERKRIEAQGISDYNKIVGEGVSEKVLRWRGIEATKDLAASDNSKMIVIGGKDGLPLILNSQ